VVCIHKGVLAIKKNEIGLYSGSSGKSTCLASVRPSSNPSNTKKKKKNEIMFFSGK
jgi:hypothetical protein